MPATETSIRWVVTVLNVTPNLGDEEPRHYGPWSRETAERMAQDVQRRLDAPIYDDDYSVTVWPLYRLTAAQIAKEVLG